MSDIHKRLVMAGDELKKLIEGSQGMLKFD